MFRVKNTSGPTVHSGLFKHIRFQSEVIWDYPWWSIWTPWGTLCRPAPRSQDTRSLPRSTKHLTKVKSWWTVPRQGWNLPVPPVSQNILWWCHSTVDTFQSASTAIQTPPTPKLLQAFCFAIWRFTSSAQSLLLVSTWTQHLLFYLILYSAVLWILCATLNTLDTSQYSKDSMQLWMLCSTLNTSKILLILLILILLLLNDGVLMFVLTSVQEQKWATRSKLHLSIWQRCVHQVVHCENVKKEVTLISADDETLNSSRSTVI